MRWLFVGPAPGFRDSRPLRWPPARIRGSVSSGDVWKAPHACLSPARPEGRAGNHFYLLLQIKTGGGRGGVLRCRFDAHKGASLPLAPAAPGWRGGDGLSVGEPAELPPFKPLIC